MIMNVGKELASLQRMSVGELQARYVAVFGEATRARHKQWLVRRIAWRLQSQAEGDLSERACRRAAELANDADLRMSPPKLPIRLADGRDERTEVVGRMPTDARLPLPGAIITRNYKGQTLQVRVLATGFEFEGEVYKSLSAVAKKITGAHCNGYYFFRLGGLGGAK